eukprot:TRINITY_DN10756_c0_g1_i1.p1 TRINITY_DN10756_c0_g1~~TRINITY_DN10756_c0_g1_i1.p1  ORF type:complete len:425 (+),score=78.13 TRINITY_DN10756_c0_g1_i1:3-1277(+)
MILNTKYRTIILIAIIIGVSYLQIQSINSKNEEINRFKENEIELKKKFERTNNDLKRMLESKDEEIKKLDSLVDKRKIRIRNNGKKISFLIPFNGQLPPWTIYTLNSMKYSKMYEWHFFVNIEQEVFKKLDPNQTNIIFHVIPNLMDYIFTGCAEYFGINDTQTISKYVGTMKKDIKGALFSIKPLLGHVFREFIPESRTSHWAFGDIDVIYGNLDMFTTDEMLTFDVFTFAHVKGGIFTRGQFTVLRNDQRMRKWGEHSKRDFITYLETGNLGLVQNSLDERVFPQSILADKTVSFYHEALFLQDDDHRQGDKNLYLEFKKGRLLLHLQQFHGGFQNIKYWETPKDGGNEGHFLKFRAPGSDHFKMRNSRVFTEFAFVHFQASKHYEKNFTAKNVDHFAIYLEFSVRKFSILDVDTFFDEDSY